MKKFSTTLIVLTLVGIFAARASLFVVDETEQVVITRLGKPVRVIQEPGLYFRKPFVEQINVFENRLLEYDSLPAEIYTLDKQTLVVDNFCKWSISDPLLFLQSVRNEQQAQSRIDDIVFSELREQLKNYKLTQIVVSDRDAIMKEVTKKSDQKARSLGINIADVRMKRADLPPENEKALYGEMRTERERKAMKYRSEGEEEATKIRAETDQEKIRIIATAYQEEQEIKGKGDAEAVRIYAEAYQQDPSFYDFLRSLEAYRKTLNKKTTIVLSPDSEFLKHLRGRPLKK
jgi:membrane protease subunit HflC